MKSQIAHSLQGRLRLRLRVPGLRFLYAEREEIARALVRMDGVISAEVTPCTEGVLLRYDPQRVDSQGLEERADIVFI